MPSPDPRALVISPAEAALERSITALHATIRALCEANDVHPAVIAEAERAIGDVIGQIVRAQMAIAIAHGFHEAA